MKTNSGSLDIKDQKFQLESIIYRRY